MDEPRLLTRTGVPAYTRSPAMALAAEPEAVPEDIQAELTWQAARTADEQKASTLGRSATELERRAEYHHSQARYYERQAARAKRAALAS